MTSEPALGPTGAVTRNKFFYGWIIVAACAILVGLTYGMMYSYSVFFKPLADYFNWDRATVSSVYSISIIMRGAVAVGVGWLADKYGARKMMVFCGFMIALGFILSSQVNSLWQLFVTYAFVEAIGLSGAFGIGTAVISRWFTHKRGLALGVMTAASGWGVVFLVPANERLVNAVGWSQAFIFGGAIAGALMIAGAFLLRPPPRLPDAARTASEVKTKNTSSKPAAEFTLKQAIRDPRLGLMMGAFFLFFFGVQLVMVHLVNYATDAGISPLVAATLISIIGAVSIPARLATGMGADRFGIHNTLLITSLCLIAAFICLSFSKSLGTLYLFAIIFSLAYGGEITITPLYVGKYFGTKAMATLVGLNAFVTNLGGALGAWSAGRIFDSTDSYQLAFVAAAVAGFGSLVVVLFLKKQDHIPRSIQNI